MTVAVQMKDVSVAVAHDGLTEHGADAKQRQLQHQGQVLVAEVVDARRVLPLAERPLRRHDGLLDQHTFEISLATLSAVRLAIGDRIFVGDEVLWQRAILVRRLRREFPPPAAFHTGEIVRPNDFLCTWRCLLFF